MVLLLRQRRRVHLNCDLGTSTTQSASPYSAVEPRTSRNCAPAFQTCGHGLAFQDKQTTAAEHAANRDDGARFVCLQVLEKVISRFTCKFKYRNSASEIQNIFMV